ncbi:PD-(D/E)XK nuclease family protein [Cronbergia sp. UHCC 0137]|uniref:PD-(D/E)XK nuclease family protein n=1 Tax=Cronbergia sp. UHCC 0137 TaxID=3110239 RepID=UPI002B21EEAE|nr:PD-(D/E)XK nuclease family protein [Cronbergia sp. UHCC 0137]MEA5619615.1 PD-(D/E)XK nuclease family protein [Cronbergia sp. UHCC 0137]
MLSTSTPLLRLSQGHLNLLTVCPRKFQHTYLEQLTTPADPDHEERQTLGSRFHLLMQQQEMGLPIDNFLLADDKLQSRMSGFAEAAPEILAPGKDDQSFRESEHYRTLQIQDYLLTVIYDLLIADQQQAQIFDWKTSRPARAKKLAENWQTRLYLYVLAETTTYLPENISMTYWFFQPKGNPQNVKFNYNSQQHEQTRQEINQILVNLTYWLQQYQQNQPFPQVPESKQVCKFCQFVMRCDRLETPDATVGNHIPNLDIIQEVLL